MKWVLKTSAVHVAKTRQQVTFRSLHDVPADLRREMKKALEGPDSETIYIANPAAYELMEKRRDPSRGKRLFWAGLGAALSAATITWVVLTLFDIP
ncbi:MAG TPA: hypothetical protein VML01_09525 [Bryobacterales bacterium]|nr:hypothetical protein [Bryobacterales bacterium]